LKKSQISKIGGERRCVGGKKSGRGAGDFNGKKIIQGSSGMPYHIGVEYAVVGKGEFHEIQNQSNGEET